MNQKPVLVTGATGYVGGRLVPRLVSSGYRVRVMARSLAKIQCRPWAGNSLVELAQADVFDIESLCKAAKGCWAAFYLVHSMNPQHKDFASADRKAAQNMAKAASLGGLERIIYLGGLGDDSPLLSKHLRSRTEVADILGSGPVPTTFLRAAMILGSGGASFEMLRYLAERLPVMVTPRWVRTPCQPIAIRNVLYYLQGCLESDATKGETFDIGGPDILSYQRLMEIYAEEAGLHRRLIVPVPFLTPSLSSYWIHLVTPVPASIARPLAEGLRNPVVCKENRIRSILPQKLLTCREAISLALGKTRQQSVETCWSDAGSPEVPEWLYCGDAVYAGGTIFESGYRVILSCEPNILWQWIERVGGYQGWYFGGLLWRFRGIIDRLIGGIGLRRGRRHPTTLYIGDAVDFWRVLEIEAPRRLVLLAEMKLPGQATLEFDIRALGKEKTELKLSSRFFPKGLFGILYWYSLYPLHQLVYKGMLKGIEKKSGARIIAGPDRFAPRLEHVCHFDFEKSEKR